MDYTSYVYAESNAEKKKSGVTLTLSKSKMTVEPGQYYLCYISKTKDTLCGMSDIFDVSTVLLYL